MPKKSRYFNFVKGICFYYLVADIYKFGLFLLELVTNKHPQERFERGEMDFLDWVNKHYPGHERKVIDGKMKLTSTTYKQIKQTIDIGLACTDLSAGHMPTISRIYSSLRKVVQLL